MENTSRTSLPANEVFDGWKLFVDDVQLSTLYIEVDIACRGTRGQKSGRPCFNN
jgi:hypothetical protein